MNPGPPSTSTPSPPSPADAAPPALALLGVHKVFKSDLTKQSQIAVDDLSLHFREGACTGLLGHNGAGKTTTIRLILGLMRPDRGQIRVSGRPLTTAEKCHIGYMPEANKLPAALTPHEILHHQLQLYARPGLLTRQERTAAVDAKLAAVGLTEHRSKRISHLSKGMARRMAWAQATIHQPRLLILDEPSSGLDPWGRREMLTWIKEEKTRGTTILLCTHELAQVSTLCDEFHVLRHGRLVLTSMRGLPATQSSAHAWRHRYNIHVSGLGEADLLQLGRTLPLPPWEGLRHEGVKSMLGVLGFTDYHAAASWMAPAICLSSTPRRALTLAAAALIRARASMCERSRR